MPTIDPALQEFFSTPDTPNKNINTPPVPITETVAPEPKPTGKPQPVDPNLLNFFNEEKRNYEKIQPKQSGLVKDPKEDDFGFWRTVGDMTLSIPQGVVNAIEEQGDFLDENIVSLGGIEFGDKDGKLSFKDFIPQYVSPKRWKEGKYSEERQLPLFYKPKTLAGNITEGVSRFITGFYTPNKFLKGAGLVGGFGVTALRGMSAGAVADLTVFDPNEGRLSDMLVEFDSPVLNNAVTQYLATDTEDTEMEGRLKNVLEGMIIGGVAEGVLFGIKAFKKAKATQNFDEKNAIYKEAGEAIKEVQAGNKTSPIVKKAIVDGNNAINVDELTKEFKIGEKTAKTDSESFIKKILNTKSFRNAEHVLKTIDDVADQFDDATKNFLENDVLRNDVAEELAKTLARNKDEILRALPKQTEAAKQGTVRMLASKMVLQEIARNLQDTSIKYVKQFGDNEKLWTKEARQEIANYANLIQNGKTKYQKAIEVFNSAYINSLLSGVFTQAVNLKSGLYEALIRPMEQVIGGAIVRDKKSIQLGFAQYRGMVTSFRDTWKAVGIALRQGDAVLDPLARTQDNLQIVNGKIVRPISAANLGFNGRVGTAVDWIGRVIELPSRLLITSDEFLKQVNYRGRLLSNALNNTMELGLDITSKEGKKNIERILKEGFDENGLANIKNNPINEKALQYARESTFTNSLNNGSYLNWGSKIENFLRQSPEFRFIMPFIRTPTNLWRHFSNRVPGFGFLTRQNQELWNSGDRRARAEVLGRQALGFAGTMYALDVALEYVETKDGMRLPKLTGNGPANFDIKKQWLSLGWQPYSFARQNSDGTVTYVQYNRMDPRFYVLGIMADLKENIANINDEDKSDIFGSAFLTVFKNVTNKTYLRGLSDVFEVLAEPTPKNISQFFGGVVGNIIPFVSFRSQGIPGIIDPDKEALETRSFIDQVIAKTPFAKDYLERKRDILTGDPIEKKPTGLVINPDGIASFSFWFMGPTMVGKSSDVKQDTVSYEVARLKLTLSPPETKKFKVDLTEFKKGDQTAYDYWLEQVGKAKDFDGTTLKQKLENTFKTSQYKSAKEGDETFDGGKEYIVKRIFEGYKKLAYANMLQKYPEVRKEIEKSQGYKYQMLTPLKAGEKQIPKGLE